MASRIYMTPFGEVVHETDEREYMTPSGFVIQETNAEVVAAGNARSFGVIF